MARDARCARPWWSTALGHQHLANEKAGGWGGPFGFPSTPSPKFGQGRHDILQAAYQVRNGSQVVPNLLGSQVASLFQSMLLDFGVSRNWRSRLASSNGVALPKGGLAHVSVSLVQAIGTRSLEPVKRLPYGDKCPCHGHVRSIFQTGSLKIKHLEGRWLQTRCQLSIIPPPQTQPK